MKTRLLSAILSFVMILTSFTCVSFTVSASETTESTYVVAGNNPDVFGLIWYKYPTENNTMKKDGDIYTFTINDIKPQANLRFQIVENRADGKQIVYGKSYSIYSEIYIEFRVVETTDVNITFDPATKNIEVFGDGVKRVTDVYRVYAFSDNSDALGGNHPATCYPESGEMTLGEDGIYSVTFKNVAPAQDIKIDILDENLSEILGFYGYNYYPIDVVETCDVTVYFERNEMNLEASKIWATGEGVVPKTKPVIGELFVSNSWDDDGYNYCTEYNKMTQVDEYVYQLKVDNLTNDTTYSFSFRNKQENFIDSWNAEYGINPISFGVDYNAIMYPYNYSWSEMNFAVPYEHSSVIITLDLTEFDYISKQGAKYRVDVTDMCGDVNGDGEVSVIDATYIQKHIVGLSLIDDTQITFSDVNGDGQVSVVDATYIQKYLVGYYNSFNDIA